MGRHLSAFFGQKFSSVVALEKGKALHKGKSTMSSMEASEAPDWGGDEAPAKDPTKGSQPKREEGCTMKGTPAMKPPPKPLPMPKQGKAQQPPRKNPPDPPQPKKVKEEQQDTQPKGRGSQSHPKDSWDWEGTWEDWAKDGGSSWEWWAGKDWPK